MSIDIHDPITELCQRLGLEPAAVRELIITPREVTATIYRINENGHKYVEGTGKAAKPATEERHYDITT